MIDKRVICEKPKVIEKAEKFKNVLNVLVCIIIIPILVVTITMLVKKIKNPKETPSFLGYRFFVILTGSMENTLNRGDFIVVKQVSEEQINENDIITFKIEETDITHRIIKKQQKNGITEYITKGDNNNSEDSDKITIKNIQGKFVFKIPVIGKFIIYLQTTTGLIIIIAIPIFMGLISFKINGYIEHKRIIRKTKRLKYDKEKSDEK